MGEKIPTELIFLHIFEIAHFCSESSDPGARHCRVTAPQSCWEAHAAPWSTVIVSFHPKSRRVGSGTLVPSESRLVLMTGLAYAHPLSLHRWLPGSLSAVVGVVTRPVSRSWWSCIKGILDSGIQAAKESQCCNCYLNKSCRWMCIRTGRHYRMLLCVGRSRVAWEKGVRPGSARRVWP